MKKVIFTTICFALLIFTTDSLQAQQPWKHQINLEVGYAAPYGGFNESADIGGSGGIGGTYYFQFLENRHIFFSAYIGYFFDYPYNNYSSGGLGEHKHTLMPMLLGARYNFSLTGFQPYVGLEVGVFNFVFIQEGQINREVKEMYTGVSPKVGFRLPVVPQIDLDVNLKMPFVFVSDNSSDPGSDLYMQWGINVGFAYTIGKNPAAE